MESRMPFGPGFWDAHELSRFFEKPNLNLPFYEEIPPNLWELSFVEACLERLEETQTWWQTISILENANRIDNSSVNSGLFLALEKERKWACRLSDEFLEGMGDGPYSEALYLGAEVPDEKCEVTITLLLSERKPTPFRRGFFAGMRALIKQHFGAEVSADEMAKLFHRVFLSWLPYFLKSDQSSEYVRSLVGGDILPLFDAIIQGGMGKTMSNEQIQKDDYGLMKQAANLIAFAAFRIGHFNFPLNWEDALQQACSAPYKARNEPFYPLLADVLAYNKSRLEAPDISQAELRSLGVHYEVQTWLLSGERKQATPCCPKHLARLKFDC